MFSSPKMATNATVYKTTAAWRARTGRSDQLISPEIVFSPPPKQVRPTTQRRSIGSATRGSNGSIRRRSGIPKLYRGAGEQQERTANCTTELQAASAASPTQTPASRDTDASVHTNAALDCMLEVPGGGSSSCGEPDSASQTLDSTIGAAAQTLDNDDIECPLDDSLISTAAEEVAAQLTPSSADGAAYAQQNDDNHDECEDVDTAPSPRLEAAPPLTPSVTTSSAARSPSLLATPPCVSREYSVAVAAHECGRLPGGTRVTVMQHATRPVQGEWLPVVWYTAHVCPHACHSANDGGTPAPPCSCAGAYTTRFRYSGMARAHRSLAASVRRQLLAAGKGGHRVDSTTGRAMLAVLEWRMPAATPLSVWWAGVAQRRAACFQELLDAAAAAKVMDADALQWLLPPSSEA